VSVVTAGVVVPVGALKCYTNRQGQWQWLLPYRKKELGWGATAVLCKKHEMESFPWNQTAFVMKPQEGMDKPFAPLRREPDGLLFDL
jgi:hypothetical protein